MSNAYIEEKILYYSSATEFIQLNCCLYYWIERSKLHQHLLFMPVSFSQNLFPHTVQSEFSKPWLKLMWPQWHYEQRSKCQYAQPTTVAVNQSTQISLACCGSEWLTLLGTTCIRSIIGETLVVGAVTWSLVRAGIFLLFSKTSEKFSFPHGSAAKGKGVIMIRRKKMFLTRTITGEMLTCRTNTLKITVKNRKTSIF